MNEVSLKPVIDELETLFSKFNKAFFEGKLEKPVITVSPDHTRGAYLIKYDVPYCSVYGDIIGLMPTADGKVFLSKADLQTMTKECGIPEEAELKTTGCDRTGCMFCGFGCHLEKQPNRFQRMAETHPKQYHFCMKPWNEGGLGLDEVLNYIHVDH